MEDKNNALSPFEEIYLEEGFYVLKIQNNSPIFLSVVLFRIVLNKKAIP